MSAVRYERRADGKLAARVSPGGDRVFLRQMGDWLGADFGAEAYERFDGGDQIFWDFQLAGERVTLHWAQEGGIALVSGDESGRNEALVRTVAERLAARIASG